MDAMQVPITGTPFLIASGIKILFTFTLVMVLVALWTLVERRVCAWMQGRLGPNRVGWQGILQPAADGLKNILKEESLPPFVDKALFMLAPMLAFIPALLTFSVIPMAAPLPTPWGLVTTAIADLPVGFLFILAVASLGVYGIALAGWASNNKYSVMGGLRASAQLISYEIAMGLAAVAVLVLAGNITPAEIIARQQAMHSWFVFPLFVAFLIFYIASFAETNRLPFDLPEAEPELVAGYHTEYSAMNFSMFFIAEYSNMLTASGLLVVLFLGGWDIPFTTWDSAPWTVPKTIATFFAFWAKTLFFYFSYIWIRWTIPRFRFDQLMDLGWKVMLPLALGYVMLISVAVWLLDSRGIPMGRRYGLILSAVSLVLGVILLWGLDRGRVLSGKSTKNRDLWKREIVSHMGAD
jgi:NADH-quinone oxidoreductase subunit H